MRLLSIITVCVLAVGFAGCSQQKGPTKPGAEEGARQITPPPPKSPLAKVQPGMSPREVEKLLGPPTSEHAYITGKAFIPWYFGRDRNRIAYFYKGLGRVVFQGGGGGSLDHTVHHVEYDPTESGRAR